MWIVLTALRRPYTFVVLALLIAIFGVRAALLTPTDIFPNINIPVVSVVWTYNGLLPNDMSGRVVYFYERYLTAQVAELRRREHQEMTDLRATVSTLAQHVQALTLENQALRSALENDAGIARINGRRATGERE